MPPKKHANAANTFDLDLDLLEDGGSSRKEPFVVKLGSRKYELVAMAELDYRVVAAAAQSAADGDLQQALRVVVRPSDWEAFSKHPLPIFKLTALFVAYSKHYGREF